MSLKGLTSPFIRSDKHEALFTKMQGCANDYIYLDCRTSGVPERSQPFCRVCRRHFSISTDGIICICAR